MVFLCTILNLTADIKKSYYEKFYGCEMITTGYFKIINGIKAGNRLDLNNIDIDTSNSYLIVSKSYSFPPMIVKFRDNSFPTVRLLTTNSSYLKLAEVSPTGRTGLLLNKYVDKPLNCSYTGIKIKLGMITLDDAKKMGNFICQVGKWLTYTWNDDWYIVVDSEPNEYNLPVLDQNNNEYWTKEGELPIFYFINKKTFKYIVDIPENIEIIKNIKRFESDKNPGLIKKFLGYK